MVLAEASRFLSAQRSSEPEVVLSRPQEQIVVVTMNRPSRLNAMTASMVSRLHEALDEVADDPSCRVVVLTGAGRGFCAGLDLAGFGQGPQSGGGRLQRDLLAQRHIAALPGHLRSVPQPVIAAVNGAATGGGLALVLAADIRIAARSARFNAAFVRIGLSGCDIGTSWLLPRLVGVARAQELMLTGRLIDAEEALRIGLVTELVDDGEVLEAGLRMADLILGNSPAGVRLTKEAMWSALETPAMQTAIEMENRQQVMLSWTEDHAEAVAAFAARRRPEFNDR